MQHKEKVEQMKKRSFSRSKNRGQSFVELALVLFFLLLLLSGMVEFGNLLNQYVNLVDGAREGARYGSNNDPFLLSDGVTYDYSAPQNSFFQNIDKVVEGDTSVDPEQRTSAIAPLVLVPDRTDGNQGDEVLIRFYAVSGSNIIGRFPASAAWCAYCRSGGHTSLITEGQIQTELESSAPSTGILVIEIFYAYNQILKMPFFTAFVPDPIQVHAYAFMPLSAAEATPTP